LVAFDFAPPSSGFSTVPTSFGSFSTALVLKSFAASLTTVFGIKILDKFPVFADATIRPRSLKLCADTPLLMLLFSGTSLMTFLGSAAETACGTFVELSAVIFLASMRSIGMFFPAESKKILLEFAFSRELARACGEYEQIYVFRGGARRV
jgi:hypothetical protein